MSDAVEVGIIIVSIALVALWLLSHIAGPTQEELEMDCVNSVAHDYLYSTNFTEENKEYVMHYALAKCYSEMRT